MNKTPAQWRQPTYGPDKILQVDTKDVGVRLQANFVEDRHLILAQGELKEMKLWFCNTGSLPIREVWVVSGADDNLWIEDGQKSLEGGGTPSLCDNTSKTAPSRTESSTSSNSITPSPPYQISLESGLEPDESMEISILFHAHIIAEKLSLLIVYREVYAVQSFFSCWVLMYVLG